MSLLYANALLLFLVILELMFIGLYKKEPIPWREIVFNLNSGHILLWILRGVEIAAFHLVASYWSFGLVSDWNYILLWLAAFISWDFCFYWLHRLHHKFQLLWAVHVVHHEGEHFSLSLGIRNSWYSSLTSFPFFIGLALFGVPLEIFIATSSVHYIVQFYNHNRVVKESGFLEQIMITPAHHRVHHGMNPEYVDKNFGGTLLIWDKLFGTFQPQLPDVPIQYGVQGYTPNFEVFSANNTPFFKLFGFRKKSNSQSQSIAVKDYWIAIGGLLLFGLLLYYIFREQQWAWTLKLAFFAIIFMGTIGLGGLSEGKKWGLFLHSIFFLLATPLLVFLNQLYTEYVLLGLFTLLALHTLALFKTYKPVQ